MNYQCRLNIFQPTSEFVPPTKRWSDTGLDDRIHWIPVTWESCSLDKESEHDECVSETGSRTTYEEEQWLSMFFPIPYNVLELLLLLRDLCRIHYRNPAGFVPSIETRDSREISHPLLKSIFNQSDMRRNCSLVALEWFTLMRFQSIG